MQDQVNSAPALKRVPWNKGKLTWAKPPLRPKHVWPIRTKLQIEGRTRDLAMFNLAIDSKLRGCDVVAIRVEGVAAGGYAGETILLEGVAFPAIPSGRPGSPPTSKLAAPSENAQLMAAHESPRTTKLYGRTGDEITLDEVERIAIRPST